MLKIITDTTCDMSREVADSLGVTLLPVHIRFGEEEYLDGIDLSIDAFYEKLIESDVFPKTSQITPFEYEKAISDAVKQGYDVLVITVSSKLSGCYQSANIAAEDIEGNVAILDGTTATMGTQLLIREALRLEQEGKSLQEIVEILEEEKKNVRVIALLNTLEYLKKGGRISTASALAGKILGLKPVVHIADGIVEALGTARGSKTGNNLLMKYVDENGFDTSKPFGLIYSGYTDKLLQKYVKDSARLYEGLDPSTFTVSKLGCTVGSYGGMDMIGFAFFKK